MIRNLTRISLLLTLSLAINACSKSQSTATQAPVVTSIEQSVVAVPHVAAVSSASDPNAPAISTKLTLAKSQLLNRTFLYGSSLQFSSLKDPTLGDTALMGLSIGETPATFRIVDSTLQLLEDQTINFESDVNHPARLIHEFKIISQDDSSITILAAEASPVLATALFDDKVAANRSSWIRSLQYIQDKNLLMWESSIEGADGSIGEFMETLVPRENIVPKDYKPLFADASLEDLATRFRFLDAGKVYMDVTGKGRIQTSVAQRWNLAKDGVVQWWVTPNAPDKFLPDIKNAVEAWNRYSQAMWGRDFIKFEGKLPANVKVGDPRYNTIVWDTVQDAGAAYESQGADPTTGIQTHSLIYMPYAWINIGQQYWAEAEFSEDAVSAKTSQVKGILAARSFMGRRLPVNCVEDPLMKLSLTARLDPDGFARGLLKTTIFHEVGHSFGLAHNFKGSLSFDPDNPKSMFSTSIMDYNEYNEEVEGAFTSLDGSGGPLLEYDRQIISALYNSSKDIKSSDPVLPACADAESDSLDGGVDPLCIRYDIGKDPSVETLKSIDLIQQKDSKVGHLQSLEVAIGEVAKSFPDASTIKTSDDATAAIAKIALAGKGIVNIYVSGGANSLANIALDDLRNLYVFQDGSLPSNGGYVEADMRSRAIQGLNFVAGFEKVPANISAALTKLGSDTHDWLISTPAMQGLAIADRESSATKLLAPVLGLEAYSNTSLLSKLRRVVLGGLKYSDTAPFYLHADSSSTLDLEAMSVGVLEKVLTTPANGAARPVAELTAEAKALAGFSATDSGSAALDRVSAKFKDLIKSAPDAATRMEYRNLLAALAPAADSSSK